MSSFNSLSLDPPLVTVALAKSAHSSAPIVAADGFAVHVLEREQRDLSVRFGFEVEDHLQRGELLRREARGTFDNISQNLVKG